MTLIYNLSSCFKLIFFIYVAGCLVICHYRTRPETGVPFILPTQNIANYVWDDSWDNYEFSITNPWRLSSAALYRQKKFMKICKWHIYQHNSWTLTRNFIPQSVNPKLSSSGAVTSIILDHLTNLNSEAFQCKRHDLYIETTSDDLTKNRVKDHMTTLPCRDFWSVRDISWN